MNKTSKKDEEEFHSFSDIFQSIGKSFSFSPIKGVIVNDFNAVDSKLASYFPPNLVAYRWGIVFGLVIVCLFLIINIFFSDPVVQTPQLIMVQVPTGQVPTVQVPNVQAPPYQAPSYQAPPSAPVIATVPLHLTNASSPVPINITDIKNLPSAQKVGGFSNLFREFEGSLFSDINDSEFN